MDIAVTSRALDESAARSATAHRQSVSPSAAPPPEANQLLASVSAEAYARLAPHLEPVYLQRGQTIYHEIGPVTHLHFPTTAIISVFSETPSGASSEVALIGNDGTLGIMAVMCGARAPFHALVDTEGHAYRIDGRSVQAELTRGTSLQRVLMRHLTARMMLIAGYAVCNSHHSVEQRFCRALLMRLEKSGRSDLAITQERMANALGVRRAGITRAIAELKRAGAIAYTRGQLLVLDRQALLRRACDCYTSLKEQIGRLRL